MPPVAFLSYAHDDAPKGDILSSFVDALSGAIAARTGEDDALYWDRPSLNLGDNWPEKLEEAVSTCRVFLPLYTPRYFKRWYCGVECAVFYERMQNAEAMATPKDFVLPVLWQFPERALREVPREFRDIQYKSDRLPQTYTDIGLLPLLGKGDEGRTDWQTVVDVLADRVADLYQKRPLGASNPVPNLKTVTSLFVRSNPADRIAAPPTGGPGYVRNIYLVATRDEIATEQSQVDAGSMTEPAGYDAADRRRWKPFPGRSETIDFLSQKSVVGLDLTHEYAPIPVSLERELREAERTNTLAAVLIDPASLTVGRYAQLAREVDAGRFRGCVVILVRGTPQEPKQAWEEKVVTAVADAFERTKARPDPTYFLTPLATADEFQKGLCGALQAELPRVRQNGTPARAVVEGSPLPLANAVAPPSQ
jgi:hypothetical protein